MSEEKAKTTPLIVLLSHEGQWSAEEFERLGEHSAEDLLRGEIEIDDLTKDPLLLAKTQLLLLDFRYQVRHVREPGKIWPLQTPIGRANWIRAVAERSSGGAGEKLRDSPSKMIYLSRIGHSSDDPSEETDLDQEMGEETEVSTEERLAEVRSALQESRELGEQAKQRINALVQRSV